jgi:hypothetical protein
VIVAAGVVPGTVGGGDDGMMGTEEKEIGGAGLDCVGVTC